MIGINIQPHSDRIFIFQATVGSHVAQRFRQHDGGTTMQDPEWLDGALIHRHPAFT